MTDGGVVRAYTYQNTGLTHSRTLMPLVDAMLRESEQSLADMDLLAVAAGPGSFTGLRIGVSALKGLAWAADKPCCGVSTLEAMAQNLRHMDGLIVCSMDARRNQVYNAVFAAEGGQLTRLTPDRAIALSQLAEELQGDPRPKLVVGDGAALCSGFLSEAGIPCRMAPAQLVMQNAVGVALAAEEMAARGETVSASLILTEMAAWYAVQGMTLFDALEALYRKYGFYGEKTHNLVMPGLDGLEKMAALMKSLRAAPPTRIAGVEVLRRKDYTDGSVIDCRTGEKTAMELSGSNVLRYELADGTAILVRPSGTEPKIKVYILTIGKDETERDENLAKYSQWVATLTK